MDSYNTIREYATAELKVKGSKFIGHLYPVKTRAAAEKRISEVKQQYHDATHNCSAFRIEGAQETEFYYDDDGEPSGTAGKPMLQVLKGEKLSNIVLVVTRYFGGTKLGTGGLARAYSETARETIRQAVTVQKVKTEWVRVRTTYDDINEVMHGIEKYRAAITDQDYGKSIYLEVAVKRSTVEDFRQHLQDATSGRIEFVSSRESL